MNVLIVGNTGKVGSFLSKSLQTLGEIYTVSRIEKESHDHFFYDFENNLGDLSRLKKMKFDLVVFCIGILPKKNIIEEVYYKVNSLSTEVLREFIHGEPKIIYLSTTSVYGQEIKNTRIYENDPIHPKDIYGKSKYDGELRVISNFRNHYILRIPPIYSHILDKTLSKRMIHNKFIDVIIANNRIQHSFCSLENLNQVIMDISLYDIKSGIYHVCDDNPFTIEQIKKFKNQKSIISLHLPKKPFDILLQILSRSPFTDLSIKYNEIHYKLFFNNIYDTKKLKNELHNSTKN